MFSRVENDEDWQMKNVFYYLEDSLILKDKSQIWKCFRILATNIINNYIDKQKLRVSKRFHNNKTCFLFFNLKNNARTNSKVVKS